MDSKTKNPLFINEKSVEKMKRSLGEEKSITHEEFVNGWKSQKIFVFVDKKSALLILKKSQFVKINYKIIDWCGTIISFIFSIPLPIALLFLISWEYGLISLIFGLILAWGSNRLSYWMILWSTFEDEKFWNYSIHRNLITIKDMDGNNIFSISLREEILQDLKNKSFDNLSKYSD